MIRTPLMIVGDGPQESSGLGRILRNLADHIVTSDLPVELVTVGGPVPPVWRRWPHYPLDERLHRGEDWGASYVEQLWASHFGRQPGILWLIWDPSRLVYYQGIQAPVTLWSYPAIDSANRVGGIGGPAGEAVSRADRVIAYGRWASGILRTARDGAVPYLPHGIHQESYTPVEATLARWATEQIGPHRKQGDLTIGCVATNQPRKDLGLYFQALAELQARRIPVYGWLHTDTMVKAWSISQLVEDCGLNKRVTVSTGEISDLQLAALYQQCAVTIAPGLGEGFGYPIVESLANGVPVVHGDYAGGRELVPRKEWRFPVREIRLEGIYANQRPLFRAEDVANAVERALDWREALGEPVAQGYCRGAVAHLDWASLWPRWRSWIRAGL